VYSQGKISSGSPPGALTRAIHDAVDERANVFVLALVGVRDSLHGDGDCCGGSQSSGDCGAIAIRPQYENVLVTVQLVVLEDRKLRHFHWGFRDCHVALG
jgi:hypothetical protein